MINQYRWLFAIVPSLIKFYDDITDPLHDDVIK